MGGEEISGIGSSDWAKRAMWKPGNTVLSCSRARNDINQVTTMLTGDMTRMFKQWMAKEEEGKCLGKVSTTR